MPGIHINGHPPEDQFTTVEYDDGTPVTCPECEDGRFLADLMIPGGIRLQCWDCGSRFTPAELARKARKKARRNG